MYIVISIVVLCVGGLILFLEETNSKHQQRINYLTELKQNYPDAFEDEFGYISSFSELERKKIKEMSKVDESSIRDKERLIQEAYRKRQKEEESKRREEELDRRYLEIKSLYPHGVELFEKKYLYSKYQIIDNEESIQQHEHFYEETSLWENWVEKQKAFSNECRQLRNKNLDTWGCYIYDVKIESINNEGFPTKYSFPVWELFCESFCRDLSLDYTTRKDAHMHLSVVEKFLSCKLRYKDRVYDRIIEFIKSLNKTPLVVFVNNKYDGNWDSISNYHFKHFIDCLSEAHINYVELSNTDVIVQASGDNIVMIDLIASNEELIRNCSDLLNICKSKSACVTYIALMKEYSSDEMKTIIESDLKKIQEKNNRKQQEEVKKQEKERSKQELKASVSNWPLIPCTQNLRFNYLLKYYPTTCEFEASDDIWNDRWTVWNFKNTPGKTTLNQHQSALNIVIPSLIQLLNNSFGQKIGKLTLVCIPASSEEKTRLRYEQFSQLICSATGMQNAYHYITIRGERGAKHAGQSGGNQSISLDKDFFKDKCVLLFDDVITSGRSMRKWTNILEQQYGATVIAAVAIGKTTHEL